MKRYSFAVCAIGIVCTSSASAEGFFKDSKATLQLRNYYFNDDFNGEAGVKNPSTAQSRKEAWAQGFLLDFTSGYTPGPVGFGLDLQGLLGIRLDSGAGRSGTALLPTNSDGRDASNFGSLGATFKARFGQGTARIGTLEPKLPIVMRSDGRLLPQTFQGGEADYKLTPSLKLTAGYLDKDKTRDSSNSEELIQTGYTGVHTSDFRYGYLTYKLNPRTSLAYYYGELRNFFDQQVVGLDNSLDVGPGKLITRVNYYHSTDAGDAWNGAIDSNMFSGMTTYSLKGHSVGLGFQKLTGESALPMLKGTTNYTFTGVGASNFVSAQERTRVARYDYDFAALGLPGLTFMTRYLSGDQAKATVLGQAKEGKEGKEWERDIELGYTVQAGTFKGVGIRYKNADYVSNFARSRTQNRVYINYTIALW